VHEHVAIARQLLSPYRDESNRDKFRLKAGMVFAKTAILSDLRVLDHDFAVR